MAEPSNNNSYDTANYEGKNNPRRIKSETEQGAHVAPTADYSQLDDADYAAVNSVAAINTNNAKKPHRRRRRVLTVVGIILIVIVVAIIGVAAWAFTWMGSIENRLGENLDPNINDTLIEAGEPGDPFYMLLLGTDGSYERDQTEEYGGSNYRSDSMMLLRIDPQNQLITEISIHRDTIVDLGEYGLQKINAAYAFGGPALAVQTVSEFAGVPISHYAEIDFDGFRAAVDALGGIEVDVPMEIDDPEAGGYLAPGLQTLNGEQALILCRSRHTYDDLGDGDLYRAANQRMVMIAIAKKLLSSDVVTMANTIDALANYITTDITSVQEIVDLAMNFRGMNMETGFYTGMNPTVSTYFDDTWWEMSDEEAWAEMMARVDAGLPPTEETIIDPETGLLLPVTESDSSSYIFLREETVSIRNGTEIDGAGADAEARIADLGYQVDVGNANRSDYQNTVIVYNYPTQAEAAQEIADALGCGYIVQNNDEYIFDTDYLILIGADWY